MLLIYWSITNWDETRISSNRGNFPDLVSLNLVKYDDYLKNHLKQFNLFRATLNTIQNDLNLLIYRKNQAVAQ